LNKDRGHHVVRTRAVYISNSTELGTVYTKQELSDLSKFCKVNDLILFMDGARLPMALTAASNDLTLIDVAALTDIFYIGGTKCGALLGEAVVIVNPELKKYFKYHLKQRGALTAKGRSMGVQFDQLLRNNLIFDLARHANLMAGKLSNAFKSLGYPMLIDSDTNQIFPVLPNPVIEKLQQKYGFLIWKIIDSDYSSIRLITSWATPEEMVDKFIEDLSQI
ncbi:MAG: threonine aldolase, partial [Bacillus cereus]|nr:threonine aldolase [Bacillus cereus]